MKNLQEIFSVRQDGTICLVSDNHSFENILEKSIEINKDLENLLKKS